MFKENSILKDGVFVKFLDIKKKKIEQIIIRNRHPYGRKIIMN
jgi:hypothetical protein